MRFFKSRKNSSKHWTVLYHDALEYFRSGDIKFAYDLSNESLEFNPLSGAFDENKTKKKMKEDPNTFYKVTLLSQTCKCLLATYQAQKEEKNGVIRTGIFTNIFHSIEFGNDLIEREPNLDLILLLDIDSSLENKYLKNRPDESKERFSYFVRFLKDQRY